MKKIFSILSVICLSVLAISCNNEMEETAEQQNGFLKLNIETLVSTNTRATAVPQGYNPKTIAVKIINSAGTVVKETQNIENDQEFKGNIVLAPDTYTITASSSGWDGSDSGFDVPYYFGSTEVTIKKNTLSPATITLTQANVKVTVNFSADFSTYFTEAECIVKSSLKDVNMQSFSMGSTSAAAYFPVSPLKFLLNVINTSGEEFTMSKEITDVKARDHFIINYKIADFGYIGGGSITVTVDDATQSYTFDVEVPRKPSISLNANAANAFSSFAYLTGAVTAKTSEFNDEYLSLQWKKNTDAEWASVPVSALTKGENDSYSYKLVNLTPATEYVYRINYNDGNTNVNSNEQTFVTEEEYKIYNSGFESWYSVGKIDICGNEADGKYWNSSNAGAATYIGSVTVQDTDFKHGGNSSAKLGTKWAVVKLAAASLFTGDFIGLIGTKGAKLDWGVPFTSRPTALKGYYSYAPGSINRGDQPSGAGAPDKGSNDACQIFCALVTELFHVANAEADGYQMTTEIDWENDPRVVAYGQMTQNTSSNGVWQELNIPLKYHSLTTKPTHLIIVCSASKWGDYFYGSDTSILHLDDFELVYGNEPSMNQ